MLVLELLCATKNLMEADIKCLANWWDSFVFSCGKLERKQQLLTIRSARKVLLTVKNS